MEDIIQQYLEQRKVLQSEFKQWVKDESIPLQVRWDLFIISELGDDEHCYVNPPGINWNRVSLYDDFYLDKYAVCKVESFIDMFKDITDDLIEHGEFEDSPYANCSVESLQRYFMVDKFIKSFCNNW